MTARLLLILPLCSIALAMPASAAEGDIIVSGYTAPFLDVILSSPVAGVVATQNFKEGDTVNAGDVILALDNRLEELEVTRRRLVAELRKADLDSTQILFNKTTGVAKEELMKKDVDHKVAVAEHEIAKEQLARRRVSAPFSGTISELVIDLGEASQPYQPLIRLVDTRQCYFICNIEAKTAAPLKLNQKVTIEISTGSSTKKVPGKIIFLSPVVDPSSGLLRVKVLFNNRDSKIRPGLTGRMIF